MPCLQSWTEGQVGAGAGSCSMPWLLGMTEFCGTRIARIYLAGSCESSSFLGCPGKERADARGNSFVGNEFPAI